MIARTGVLAAFVLTLLGSHPRLAAADPEPTYDFVAGEQYLYEMVQDDLLETEEQQTARVGQPQDRYTFTVTPVRKNPDGSWRLLVRTQLKMWSRSASKPAELRLENDFLGYCDLRPDGGYTLNPTLGQSIFFGLVPEWLFPPLPRKGQPVRKSGGGGEYHLVTVASSSERVKIAGEITRPSQNALAVSESISIELARPGGTMKQLVREVSSKDKRPYHERTIIKLACTTQLSADEIDELDRTSTEYFGVSIPAWQKQTAARESRTVAECESLQDDAQSLVRTKLDSPSEPQMRELYVALQAILAREWKFVLSDVKDREKLYAQAPIDWTTTNIDGKPRRRQDYDGRIVVMDFWYRECSWCIKAMPQVKRLHYKYRDQPVVVLGVSNDKDVADARFVIDTVGIPYETIRNAPPKSDPAVETISMRYAVHAWPTLVVLDQNGRVAHVHSGEIGLYDSVSGAIDKLLAESADQNTAAPPSN